MRSREAYAEGLRDCFYSFCVGNCAASLCEPAGADALLTRCVAGLARSVARDARSFAQVARAARAASGAGRTR